MMNKSKIDWCDFSWNPITGCRHSCEYCYARKQARRFSGDVRLNKRSEQLQQTMHFNKEKDKEAYCTFILPQPFKNDNGSTVPFPVGFEPTLHEYRLQMPAKKKKPANIFVCSMADLFGEWVPEEWILRVFEACKAAPWHNYLFLTKNPKRYCDLANAGKLPTLDNFWYGTTVTKKGAHIFGGSVRYNTFISIEPLLEPLDVGIGSFGGARWIIIGAETGNRAGKVKPEREWIENIVETARITHAAVILKDSDTMREVWGDDLIQEFPPELEHDDAEIPHCKECEHCIREPQGDRGEKCICEIIREAEGCHDRGGRHILGRYTRTSPPWCPRRKEETK